jgi:hypothetical protein
LTRDPFLLACFAVSLCGALVLNFCVSAIIGSLAFFIDSATSVWELWLGGFMMFSGYLVPLELFPAVAQSGGERAAVPAAPDAAVQLATGQLGRAAAVSPLLFQAATAALAILGMLVVFRLGLRRFARVRGLSDATPSPHLARQPARLASGLDAVPRRLPPRLRDGGLLDGVEPGARGGGVGRAAGDRRLDLSRGAARARVVRCSCAACSRARCIPPSWR